MTPLATATGGFSNDKWAAQAVLAIKHYIDAVANPEKWKRLDWPDAGRSSLEVKRTHAL